MISDMFHSQVKLPQDNPAIRILIHLLRSSQWGVPPTGDPYRSTTCFLTKLGPLIFQKCTNFLACFLIFSIWAAHFHNHIRPTSPVIAVESRFRLHFACVIVKLHAMNLVSSIKCNQWKSTQTGYYSKYKTDFKKKCMILYEHGLMSIPQKNGQFIQVLIIWHRTMTKDRKCMPDPPMIRQWFGLVVWKRMIDLV